MQTPIRLLRTSAPDQPNAHSPTSAPRGQPPTHKDVTRINELSADRIRLTSRPPWWLVALFGSIFSAVLFGLCPSYELTCRQTEAHTVDLRVRRQLFGHTLSERTITGVTGATVENGSDSSGNRHHRPTGSRGSTFESNPTARIVFITRSGRVPLVSSYAAGRDGFQLAADELNQILASPRAEGRVVKVPSSHWFWGLAAVLGLITITILPGGTCRCLIDRSENVVRISWPTFLGSRHAEFALTDVESFRVVHRIASVTSRQSEDQPQRLGDFVYAIKNFRRLQQASFEKSIGVRLHNGSEFSITRQSGAKAKPSTEELIHLLEKFRRGEL